MASYVIGSFRRTSSSALWLWGATKPIALWTLQAASLSAVVLGVLLALGCSSEPPKVSDPAPPLDSPQGPVTVEIVHRESIRTLLLEAVPAGTTVETVMRSIEEVPVAIRGSGTTAFIDSIDGVKTGSGTGWTYRINGEFVDRGIGATELVPPATVRWTFGRWDEPPTD